MSTTELAELAGVTRGVVHHYFGTKRGLYLEVVRRMVLLRLLMISSLVTIVREVLPVMPTAAADSPDRSPAAAHQR